MNNLIQITLATVLVLSMAKSLNIAIFVSILMPVLIILDYTINKIPNHRLLSWIKGFSIFIPLVIFTCFTYINKIIKIPALIFSFILAINILEPPLIVQFFNEEPLSIINGLLTVILALYTPILSLDKSSGLIGYNNHWLWTIANTTILGSFYLFHDFLNNGSVKKWLLFSLILPTAFCLIAGSTKLWFALRVYSLALALFLVRRYEVITQKSDEYLFEFTKNKYDWLRLISIVINTVITILMINQGNKNTIIGYLLNKV